MCINFPILVEAIMRRQDRMVTNIDEIKDIFKQHAYHSPRHDRW